MRLVARVWLVRLGIPVFGFGSNLGSGLGSKRFTTTTTTRLAMSHNNNNDDPVVVFCDMDGVLVDFNAGVYDITGVHPDDLPIRKLWQAVGRKRDFFESLDWTPDGRELWEAILPLRPTLLTGVPNSHTAEVGRQKASWCRREFGCPVRHTDKAAHKPQRHATVHQDYHSNEGTIHCISCWTRFKHHECRRPGSILIDDRLKTREAWEQAGGIFVHHTSTKETLRVLRDLGVLPAGARGVGRLIERAPNRDPEPRVVCGNEPPRPEAMGRSSNEQAPATGRIYSRDEFTEKKHNH